MSTMKWLLRENILAASGSFGCFFQDILKKRENFSSCKTLYLPLLPSIQMAQTLINLLKYLFDGFEGFPLFIIPSSSCTFCVDLDKQEKGNHNKGRKEGVTKTTTRKQKKQQGRTTACNSILHRGL